MTQIEGTLSSSHKILVVVVWLFWLVHLIAMLLHNQNLALILSALLKHFLEFQTLRMLEVFLMADWLLVKLEHRLLLEKYWKIQLIFTLCSYKTIHCLF